MTTAPATEKLAVVPLMPRFRFRVDVCAVLTPTSVRVVARDVLAALELPMDQYEDEPSHDRPFSEHATATTWSRDTLADILAVIDDRPEVAAFLAWLDERISLLGNWGLANMHRGVTETVNPSTGEVADDEPDQFSVADAARLLDRDPTITIGQTALFEWLHSHGWISRVRDPNVTWKPQREVLLVGYLTVLDNRVQGHRDLYPQICITTVGMHALHERLGGSATLNLHPALDTPLLKD